MEKGIFARIPVENSKVLHGIFSTETSERILRAISKVAPGTRSEFYSEVIPGFFK